MKRHSDRTTATNDLPPEWEDTPRNPPRSDSRLSAFEATEGVCLFDPEDPGSYILAPGVAVTDQR